MTKVARRDYGLLGEDGCHGTGHGTAFKTRWMNDVIYQISCLGTMREPIVRRWDHTRPPYRNTIEAYREIIPTLRRQLKDPGHYVHRPLPSLHTTAHSATASN